jgi:ABC-type transport system involved in multi-copper enzyme maturation permease subunit
MSVIEAETTSPPVSSIWEQTQALFIDAYRDLAARKLFWLTLAMSALVSGAFLAVGINESGFTILGRQFPSLFNTNLIPAGTFYKLLFVQFAIPFWLGFLATVLALVSVAGIIPDMIVGGSIELYLSKPITRLRLFLTKYAFGLLFTAAQVLVFCTVAFFVIGTRSGTWEPRVFLAVPLVTLFFSYLYCVCVLVGIVTRSALAAILLTALFWGTVYVIHVTDGILTQFSAAAEYRLAQQKNVMAMNDRIITENDALPPERRGNMSAFIFQRDAQRKTLDEYQSAADDLRWWKDLIFNIKTPLPKTNETVTLMSRVLVGPDPILAIQQEQYQRREAWRQRRGGPATRQSDRLGQFMNDPDVTAEAYVELNTRNLFWIIGSSLLFEGVILALAAWLFCRRDY